MKASVIITGRQGSGKTQSAPALARFYGLRHIHEDAYGKVNRCNTLIVAIHESDLRGIEGLRVISIDQARAEARIPRPEGCLPG